MSGINAATVPGSVEDSDRLPRGGIGEPMLDPHSGRGADARVYYRHSVAVWSLPSTQGQRPA